MLRRLTRSSVVVVVGMLAVTLSGCIEVESTFTINEDATADMTTSFEIDTEAFADVSSMLGEDVGDLGDLSGDLSGDALLEEIMGDDDPCASLASELSEYEASTTQIDEDGKVGVSCTVSGVPLDELGVGMAATEDGPAIEIVQDDEGTRFTATLTGVDDLAGTEGDQLTEMLDLSFEDLVSIVFTVSAPGSLGDNNATSTDDSAVSWQVTPDADFVVDGTAEMHAEWAPGGGGSGSSLLWWVVGVVAAALVVGLILYLIERKRSRGGGDPTPSVEDAAPAPAAPIYAAPSGAPFAPPTAPEGAPPTTMPPTTMPPTFRPPHPPPS